MQLPFTPMQLTPASAPFADPGWIYQVKWDGVRNLTLVADGRVRHWSRRLRDRTASFPELDGLARLFGAGRAVLDGEIIVLRDGKPSFSAILERDLGGTSVRARNGSATFMIFDLLEYGDRELYSRPVEERLDLLRRLVSPGQYWDVVASFPGTAGPDLFRAIEAKELEGVVAKRLGSPYSIGRRTRDWLKIKRRQRLLAVLCGYTTGGLLLGAYVDSRLQYIGRVGSGLKEAEMAVARSQPAVACPFDRVPGLRDRFSGTPGPVTWVQPLLTLQVEFSDWTDDQKLRDPVFAGFAREPPQAAQLPPDRRLILSSREE